MDVFLLVLILIIIFSSIFCKKNFNNDFLDHNQTLCINGIFVVLVLLRHASGYCDFSQSFSMAYNFIDIGLKQLIVTTFLFYSGYGIYESIKNKPNYINTKLSKRIVKLYSHFLIALITFLIMNILLKIKYDIKTIILSFFTWKTIGNSNWYVFAIICMYLFTYLCFKIFKKDKNAIIAITLLTNLYTIILSLFKGGYWYNTVICFSFGLWFSYYKKEIFKFLTSNNYMYCLCLIIAILNFYTFCKIHPINMVFYEFWSISFVILILIISLKFKIYSKVLFFLGRHTFWIYILQRIPMIILEKYNINNYNNYLYVILTIVSTIIMAVLYDKIFSQNCLKEWLDKKIKDKQIKFKLKMPIVNLAEK